MEKHELRQAILHSLQSNDRISTADLAVMLGMDEAEVIQEIKEMEDEKLILGYGALVNWDRFEDDHVTALIEVNITPQRDLGFDQIARRLYSFPQVSSCYLMSGGYDLMVIIEDRSLMAVAKFVSNKIAPLESVLSTRTHFILKKYKVNGHILSETPSDNREAVIL